MRDHTTAQQDGDLVSIDAVILGFAAMDCFQIQCVSQNEGNALRTAQIGKPVPGKKTLDANDDVIAKGLDQIQKDIEIRRQIFLDSNLA